MVVPLSKELRVRVACRKCESVSELTADQLQHSFTSVACRVCSEPVAVPQEQLATFGRVVAGLGVNTAVRVEIVVPDDGK